MIGFVLSLFGCTENTFKDSDFVGVWKSDDGANIIINEDKTCVLNGLNNSIVGIAEAENEKLNTNGTWQIIQDVNSGITGGISTGIKISYNLMGRTGKGGIEFYISGQGISENKSPWNLFIWKGDPDEMVKYKFSKQTKPSN